jgi:hypothetical protein
MGSPQPQASNRQIEAEKKHFRRTSIQFSQKDGQSKSPTPPPDERNYNYSSARKIGQKQDITPQSEEVDMTNKRGSTAP